LAQYELNLRDYLRIFHKRKIIIILTFIIVTLGSIVFTPKVAPTFKASATIKIEERKTIAGLLTEWIVYNPGIFQELLIVRFNRIIMRHSALYKART
jgi:uncharacterized protein involved in exopolysaccharide biosynthesis